MLSQTSSTRDGMHSEFNEKFAIGRQFVDRDELNATVITFGKKYNVVFSIFNSHPGVRRFHYICKHGKTKRVIGKNLTAADFIDDGNNLEKDDEEDELIDLTEKKPVDGNKKDEEEKSLYRKSTQKLDCPASFHLFNMTVTQSVCEHNHPISQDVTIYAKHRKQNPEVMERIYTLLASGHKDPVTSVMDESIQYGIFDCVNILMVFDIIDFTSHGHKKCY